MFSPETLQALARMHYIESRELARLSHLLHESRAPRPQKARWFARLLEAAKTWTTKSGQAANPPYAPGSPERRATARG